MMSFGPREMFILDQACKPIREAFVDRSHSGMTGLYLVGSAMNGDKSMGTKDIDVRLMLDDAEYDALLEATSIQSIRFLGLAIGQYLASVTGMPIDFQIQRTSNANAKHKAKEVVKHMHDEPIIGCRCAEYPSNVKMVGGLRNPLGTRSLDSFVGDAE